MLIFDLSTVVPEQDSASNNDNSPKNPPSSDSDLFGDEEELLQVLETDDAAWTAVSGFQQTQDDNKRHVDSIVQPLLDDDSDIVAETIAANQSQILNLEDVDDSRSNASSVVDAMLMSDHYADLPDSPEFSLDDLPIFSKKRTIRDNDLIETTDSQTVTRRDSLRAMEIDNVPPQTQNSEVDMLDIDLGSILDESAVNNDNSEVVVGYNQSTQKMSKLDLNDKLPSTANANNSKESNADPGQATPSSTAESEHDELASRFKLSLRQRNAIQLHPFTLEQARFQHLIGRSSIKDKIKVVSTQVIDSQDTEFTLSNTQLVDAPTNEIEISQADSGRKTTTASKKKSARKTSSLPSRPKKHTQNRPNITSITSTNATSRADTVAIDGISSPVLVDEYNNGLDPLKEISKITKSSKPKMITFQKKKRSKREKSAVRRFPPSSSASALNKDIFDFDALPQSTFNFASSSLGSSNASNIATSDQDSRVQLQLREMNDEADYNDFYYSMEENDNEFDGEEAEDMDIDNEDIVKRRFRIKKLAILDSSDEDQSSVDENEEDEQASVEQEPTEAELDAIFDFPGAGPSSTIKPAGRRLIKPSRQDDIVPIVQDELEYREHKRQKVGLQDVLKKEKTLRSILPASFRKVYHKELLEEDKLRKTPKKRTANATKSTTNTTTIASAKQTKRSSNKPLADVFAAFLGSQSEDDSDEDSDDLQDAYSTLDDYVTRLDYLTQAPAQGNTRFEGSATTSSDSLDFFGKSTKQAHLNSSSNLSSTRTTKRPPHSTHRAIYPIEESSEYNRIDRQYHGSYSSRQPTRTTKKSTARAPRSSIAIKAPPKNPKKPPSIATRDNPAPKKRRKKVKRTRDDIYVHAPYSYRACNDRSGQAPDNNGRRYFQKRADTPRMAFDDIYVGTRQYVRYASEGLDANRFNDMFSHQQNQHANEKMNVHVIHSLPSVISRVRHLHDYDLRRILGLKDTVYLHHSLLAPLLSPKPDLKSAYKHLAANYTPHMNLFDKHLLWKDITPQNKNLIRHLFYKVSDDIRRICKLDALDECTELPGHDHFYTFVSICLTQWIPLHQYDDRIQLTEMFMRYIRYLGRLVPQLVEECKMAVLAWRPIVKLMVYILDWTCRLHHLGVHQIHWSVRLCTKALIDILVFIGFDDIKSCSKDYLSEAWICLLQIMSVSSKTSGFYFYEQTFVDQMTDSIKTKSRNSGVYEFEKRRTTRLWAESLNFIIEKYMIP
ncbi:hypothetical protein [Parasitella parasitica]|uniref:Uncharacterized protein n=1 Tax=Parasitella parasitica TaxID=35722 RepID=A0A0B7N6L1_9FUNG|nr:hypothetical protein [Parasitella parasitica]